MWDKVLQVLSGTRRFSLLFKALKASGLVLILSSYIVIAIIVGVEGSIIAVITIMVERGNIFCFDLIRHDVLALFVFGEIVNVMV